MKTRPVWRVSAGIILAVLILLGSASGVFADFTPPGSVKQYSWDPSEGGGSPKWTNGTNAGYWEGETAAMAAEISNESGNTYDLPICLQVWELPLPTKGYGFTAFEPFHTTTRAPNLPPPTLPGDETITYDGITGLPVGTEWDLTKSPIYGYNITINSVSAPVVGAAAGCDTNELGVTVNYTPAADSSAYIVWGGHIAKAGDPLPAGSPDTTVPVGKSAGFTGGNFQARLQTTAADKTLPFQVDFGPNAIAMRSLEASSGVAAFAPLALLGLLAVVVTALVYRRLPQA